MLFHFSEDDSINIFVPKQKQNRPDFPAVVWAIDEEHEFSYYFLEIVLELCVGKMRLQQTNNYNSFLIIRLPIQ